MSAGHDGLSNNQALLRLREEILSALQERKSTVDRDANWRRRFVQFLQSLRCENHYSPYFWTTTLLTLVVALAYLFTYCTSPDYRFSSLLGEWLLLSAFLAANLSITVWLHRRRSKEITQRCRFLANRLGEFADEIRWGPGDFPNLFTPLSPCIAIQWTYRDGSLVNVPWALLVAGDVILLKPGQEVPGRCISCDTDNATELKFGDVFAPVTDDEDDANGDQLNVPHLRTPCEPKPHRLLDTPVMNGIRFALDHATIRPSTVFERERRMAMANAVERFFVPLVVTISLGVNAYRYFYLNKWSGEKAEMLLLLPAMSILPLVALTFPVFWVGLNLVGSARILATYHALLNTTSSSPNVEKASCSDAEAGETEPMMKNPQIVDSLVKGGLLTQIKFLLGFGSDDPNELPAMWLSSNLLHVLASVSALCCVDKKGILSWPNPVADKVFFFRYGRAEDEHVGVDSPTSNNNSGVQEEERESTAATPAAPPPPPPTEDAPGPSGCSTRRKLSFEDPALADEELEPRGESPATNNCRGDCQQQLADSVEEPAERPVVPEVLDLYLDPNRPFHLQFDDPSVSKGRHLKSLKPLGLAALLNTCNPETQNHYAHFCSHITAQAMTNEALVPVTNRSDHSQAELLAPHSTRTALDLVDELSRGCLCELAHQIGFTETAAAGFELCDQLASFRHVEASLVQSSRLAKSLSTAASARLKFPFPHMVGVVVKEAEAGGCQLLSQGTADIVLDCCADLWDGQDLVSLNDPLRKKILDFYHRSSLTAYCTAFAYCPILFPLGGDVSSKYLELPPEGHQVNFTQSPTPIPLLIHPEMFAHGKPHGHMRNVSGLYLSNDSLSAGNHTFFKVEERKESGPPATASAWACLMAQSQQIFLGMVTMQYQARPPLVQLVEHLEAACIRFVHFSKENELRSRVFSEKMGLESGWNCHISLLSEKSAAKSDIAKDTLTRQLSQYSHGDGRKPSFRREKRGSSLVDSKPHSFSAPSAMNLDPQKCADGDGSEEFDIARSAHKRVVSEAVYFREETSMSDVRFLDSMAKDESDEPGDGEGSGTGMAMGKAISVSQESSHFTDSTEQTAPVPFDMSNRAKLPRGIENIRPHLKQVDNVPLLVSLFTDCTPSACEEMVRIMQDNDQVVCVLGSTASAHNTVMFLQADAALGIEPLYPQVCMKMPVTGNQSSGRSSPSPTDVSHLITSLPCALSFRSNQPLVIFELMREARNFMKNARNALQFWLCASGALSLMFLLSSCCLLPPILRPNHMLTLGSIIAPIFSIGLIGNPVDDRVMNNPTGRLQTTPDTELVLYVLWFYGMKFVPSVVAVVAFFFLSLWESCSVNRGPNCLFVYESTSPKPHAWGGWGGGDPPAAAALLVSQNICALLAAVYLAVISVCFVHRMDLLWEKSPLRNIVWTACILIGVTLQAAFCALDLVNNDGSSGWKYLSLPSWLLVAAAVWPFVVLGFNEAVKRREIFVTVRYLKRARLEFGTKLGMNSPF